MIKKHADEIDASGEGPVTHLSLLAYSLGGPITRYAAGKLEHEGAFLHSSPPEPEVDSRWPQQGLATAGRQRRFIPLNFVTVATPHLGAWKYPDGWIAKAFNKLVPVMASWTGHQLMYKV